MSFFKWSKAAASNATADPSINWAEGQAPSTVNDSARAMMAAASKYRDDIAGAISTGGSLVAFTVSSYQAFDTLAHMDGAMIAFTPHVTNGGTCTLSVDGLGARPLRSAPGIELGIGMLVQGTPYAATYFNATGEWILRGFFGGGTIPLGVALPFFAAALPGSNFAFPFGQAISRTTYASLFTLLGTSYGAGDGSTTFNIPDLRGYLLAGKDDMGGSAASRITSGGSGIAGATLGAAGGQETVTLVTGQMPVHSHGVSDPTHAHSVIGSTAGASADHTHTYSGATSGQSADHTHNYSAPTSGGSAFTGGGSNQFVSAATSGTSGDHTHAYSGTTSGRNVDHSHSINFASQAASTGISIGNAGSGTAHQNMPPTRICNFILRIL